MTLERTGKYNPVTLKALGVWFIALLAVVVAGSGVPADACCDLMVEVKAPATACPGEAIDAYAVLLSANPEHHEITYTWTQDGHPATGFTMPASGSTGICVTATDTVTGCVASACAGVDPLCADAGPPCGGINTDTSCNVTESPVSIPDYCTFGSTTFVGLQIAGWTYCFDCPDWRIRTASLRPVVVIWRDNHFRSCLGEGTVTCQQAEDAQIWKDSSYLQAQGVPGLMAMCDTLYIPCDCLTEHERFHKDQLCQGIAPAIVPSAVEQINGLSENADSGDCAGNAAKARLVEAARAIVERASLDIKDIWESSMIDRELAAWYATWQCVSDEKAAICSQITEPCDSCP